jgi:hypothetical protein
MSICKFLVITCHHVQFYVNMQICSLYAHHLCNTCKMDTCIDSKCHCKLRMLILVENIGEGTSNGEEQGWRHYALVRWTLVSTLSTEKNQAMLYACMYASNWYCILYACMYASNWYVWCICVLYACMYASNWYVWCICVLYACIGCYMYGYICICHFEMQGLKEK